MSKKKTPEERMAICKKCPHLKKWKVCDICKCFMPLKTKIRWAECPLEDPKWT
jgi:recombinational DNA repair protein RecR